MTLESGDRRPRPRRRRYVARAVLFALLWSLLAGIVFTGSAVAGLLRQPVDLTPPPPPRTALLLDSRGAVIGTIRPSQSRIEVPDSAIPQVLKDAFIADEDKRFFSHQGVDPLALARAAFRDLTGSSVQGGSTITQQYVKNEFTNGARTRSRKFKEAAISIRLEQRVPKEQILLRYLNTLYLGNSAYGVQAASQYYFGVDVSHLTLSEASMLAGLAPAPSDYDPVAHFALARDRQQTVLNRMIANGMITSRQATDAYDNPPTIVGKVSGPAGVDDSYAPEFRDYALASIRSMVTSRQLTQQEIDTAGLRVSTTLDPDWQAAIAQAVKTVLPQASDPEAATVVMDYRNGDVLALTTKRDGGYSSGGFDLAMNAVRNSGSSIKPFTLATALEQGHSVDEGRVVPNCITEPYYIQNNVPQKVCNADGAESGYFTLRSALWYSVNTVYMPLAHEVGNGNVANVARAAGLGPFTPRSWLVPAAGLGVPITPMSEADGYATLADGGMHHAPRALGQILAAGNGNGPSLVLHPAQPAPPGDQVIPQPIAQQVDDAMLGVVTSGTATAARQPFPVFGKTGTNEADNDAWFTGCPSAAAVAAGQAPPVCITTWMGYDHESRSMLNVENVQKVQGGTLPAQIFAAAWANYRARKAAAAAATATPAPTPTATSTYHVVVPVPTRVAPRATYVPVRPAPTYRAPTPVVTPVRPTLTPAPPSRTPTPPPLPTG